VARANGSDELSERRLPVGTASRRAGARLRTLAAALLVVGVLAVPVASAAQTRGAARPSLQPPLPASDYAVRSVCAQPDGPDTASCLALRLVPLTTAARAHTHLLEAMSAGAPPAPGRAAHPAGDAAAGLYGLRPQDLHAAYALPTSSAAAKRQTIALVDAYDDPHAEADLTAYDREFGLPECSAANGCFRKLDEEGRSSPLPATEGEWAMEISLDIETAHAICQECKILLIEATSPAYADLEAAEREAVALGASEISDSWGGGEPSADSEAFNDPGVVITAASGDYGYRNWDDPEGLTGFTDYPASSPHVVAVGGTRLKISAGGAWASEQVWNGQGASGGGCSDRFAAPSWQRSLADWPSVGCQSRRAVADVAADADPYTGVAVYDSTPIHSGGDAPGWLTLGGTSLSSPLVSATFALAGGARSSSGYAAQTLYAAALSDPASLHSITSGSNGECTRPFTFEGDSGCSALEEAASCSGRAICLAGPGYNGPAGVGTPAGICAFEPSDTCSGPGEGGVEAPGSGSGTNGSGASARGAGGGEAPPESATAQTTGLGEGAAAITLAPSLPSGARPAPARISRLTLSARALAALRGRRAKARVSPSELSFRFSLSRAADVRVTLARLQSSRGRERWRPLGAALVLRGAAGVNRAHLGGSAALAPGRYRLTLTPEGGRPRSLELTLR
jgi:Subtilase family